MKKIVIGFIFLLFGCISMEIREVKYNELSVKKYKQFDGRIFSINCSSSDYDMGSVKEKCIKEIASKVLESNYLYFIIITANQDRLQSNYIHGNSKSISGGTITENTINYTFILLKEDEIENYDNYYKALDYINN